MQCHNVNAQIVTWENGTIQKLPQQQQKVVDKNTQYKRHLALQQLRYISIYKHSLYGQLYKKGKKWCQIVNCLLYHLSSGLSFRNNCTCYSTLVKDRLLRHYSWPLYCLLGPPPIVLQGYAL